MRRRQPMKVLKCDKPYNVDENRRQRGLPKKRRKDPQTTCFELCIRVPDEYRDLVGKKKHSKTVYVLNKKVDLKAKVDEFETEKNNELEALIEADVAAKAEHELEITANTPTGIYLNYYIDVRVNSVSKDTIENERSHCKYASEVIGGIPLGKLTSNDVDKALQAVPRLSEKWALELRAEREKKRNAVGMEVHHRKLKPLGPIKIAGPDKQYKVLKFLREALNFAVEKEVLTRTVARARFLTRLYKKSKPKVDPLMEDEAGRFLEELDKLETCYFKIGVLLLLGAGIRPEEMQAVRLGNFSYIDDEPCLSITGVVPHGSNVIVDYDGKSNAALRSIPIDDSIYEEVLKWAEILKAHLADMGIRFTLNTPLFSDTGMPVTYNTFKRQWNEFSKKAGFEGVRPYALRHTFATITLAHGENIKTVSYLMGHESTAYTTDLYAAWVPNTRTGIGRRYIKTLRKAA